MTDDENPNDMGELDDFLPEPITFPERKQKILLPNGKSIKINVLKPPTPAPVFHDTAEENHIDDDLNIANFSLRNLGEMWQAVRTVEQACALADKTCKVLEHRRRLANKQLGAKEGSNKGVIYHIPD